MTAATETKILTTDEAFDRLKKLYDNDREAWAIIRKAASIRLQRTMAGTGQGIGSSDISCEAMYLVRVGIAEVNAEGKLLRLDMGQIIED
jgi:hypothetical protein